MTQRLEGKRAVITGGGRGIGKAIALAYALEGAQCVITSRNLDDLEVTSQEAPTGTVRPVVCDVSDDTSVSEMAQFVHEQLGGVDIVVNNAGIHAAGRFLDIDPATYSRLYEVNVVGIVRVSQAFLGGMIERGSGSIVNIASTAGLFESPGQAPYNASKHGAVGLTRCMGLELASSGVTCNAICPGFVDTPMLDGFADLVGAESEELRAQLAKRTPMGRILSPDEIAHLAVYLGSDEASGMTGQTMAISNGMRMS
ncbi:MAG: SDR family NAD(P)-dependent oxidoreductase [Acidimicrobiales bacterium]|jgi:NAD(P)-dependent dehydrogenase (short-subunit alcohol dehydrogenase family)|nr:SDR family NAD(P)-dependent oxidoreductase [Acidimicrobiales bacterium]